MATRGTCYILYIMQGPYTFGHLQFKAIEDFSRQFEKEIQDCFNDMYF